MLEEVAVLTRHEDKTVGQLTPVQLHDLIKDLECLWERVT